MRRALQVLLLFSCCLAPAALAEGPSGWAFSAGSFDPAKEDFQALELGIEYRFKEFDLWGLELKPMIGASGTEDDAWWAYAGLRWDIAVFKGRIIPTLGFAAAYYEQGDGKDLGQELEFRSSFEIAYRFDDGSRLGIQVYHLSNASLSDFNPGSESVVLTYSLGR